MLRLLSLLLVTAGAPATQAEEPPAIRVKAASERVCAAERQPSYLNVDFIVENPTDEELALEEIHATVLTESESAIEKRLVWQGALDTLGLGPGAKIAPGSTGLVFNPVHLTSAAPGMTVRYEFGFSGDKSSAAVDVVPQLCRTNASLRLPLSGRVLVLDGHDALSHHRRFNYLAPWARRVGLADNIQRFALDLVIVDETGRHFHGSGARNEDFYGWGKPVRAPASGVVVATHNDQPDNDVVGAENKWTDKSWENASGNYVVIRHNVGEFSVISHLRQDSLKVRRGDRVHAGEIVGEVNNSGSSLMPHVHYQLQDALGVEGVHGIPAYFRDVRLVSGQPVPAHGIVLDTGDIVLSD